MAHGPDHLNVNVSSFERPQSPLLEPSGRLTFVLRTSTPDTGYLEECEPPSKGNRSSPPEDDDQRVDLSKYGLPEALTNPDEYLPEKLANIITTSVGNVVSQIAVEKELRLHLQDEEKRKVKEHSGKAEETGRGGDKGKGIQAPSERSDHLLVNTPPPTEATTSLATTRKASPGTQSEVESASSDTAATADDRSQGNPSPVANMTASSPLNLKKRHLLKALFRRLSDAELYLGLVRSRSSGELLHPDLRERLKKTKRAFHLNQETSECLSCFEDFAPKHLVKLKCHNYCKPCFRRLIENAIETEAQWPPKCCLSLIDHKTCLKNTSGALSTKYMQRRQEFSTPIHGRYYCPVPDCGQFVPADRANTPFRRAKCRSGHLTCMDCLGAAHADAVQCAKNQDMGLVQQLGDEEGWRRCHRCHTMIEHSKACRHITCRCGAEFCFVCGAAWWTCGCTERQLQEMKLRARRNSERRREAEARERREARELQEALEAIARMEAEASEKLERTRAAKETRRKVLVTSKHADLMALLAEVNEGQRGVLQGQHARDRRALLAQIQVADEGLRFRNATRIEELRADSRGKIEKREKELWQQYNPGPSQETSDDISEEQARVPSDQVAPDKEDNEAKEGWPQYRDERLRQFRSAVEDEQTIEEDLMHAKTERLLNSFKAQQREMQVKNISELRWFELVVAERARLLEEMLTAELEDEIVNDDDYRWDTIVVREAGEPEPSRDRRTGYRKRPG